MKKGKNPIAKIVICALLLCAVLVMICVVLLSPKEEFNGTCTADANTFSVDFTAMTQTREHRIYLEAGESLTVSYTIFSGKADLVIGMEGETAIYVGNRLDRGAFEVSAPTDGEYLIRFRARKAEGLLLIERKNAE